MAAHTQSLPIPDRGAATARHVLFLFDQLRCLDGGAEGALLKIVQLLPADRYRASVATFWTPRDNGFLCRFPCPVHVFPLDRTYGFAAAKAALKLRRLIRSERVQIVQTFFATSDLWGGLVAKASGCPVLVSSRRDMGFTRTRMHRAAYRLLAPLFDQVHTVSEAVREATIREDRVRPERVVSIPNGVDLAAIPPPREAAFARSAFGLGGASHAIVDVGTVKPIKGYDTLARTAAIVCREYPKAVFVVVGRIPKDGYIDELRGLVASLGLTENFRFTGHFDNVFPVLQMCDVFCHLSRTDGLSNAVLEAMACGLPCIVSRAGGNPEVVEEGRSGFVIPEGEPEAAAERILTLLGSRERARRMGRRGREIIERDFTAEAMVRGLARLYDGLLAAKGLG
jgi:glycosyltransferase involved in cell wall biosynthesis